MILEKVNIDNFKNIFQIPLTQIPNQIFDVYVDNLSFKLEFRTYASDNTRLNIYLDNEIIVNNAPVNIDLYNLCYFSTFKKGAFFFLSNPNKYFEKVNFESFIKDGVNLFYGSF